MVLLGLCVCRGLIPEIQGEQNLHFKTHIKKIMKIGAGETDVVEKRLSGKLKGLHSDPRTHVKSQVPQCVSAGLGESETG